MNKTEKYQLNQWEKTDRIQMEDFNHDNAKIEAALTEQAAVLETKASQSELAAARQWVKIAEVTAASVTIPNVAQYRQLRVFLDFTGGYQCSIKWNGTSMIGLQGTDRYSVLARAVGVADIIPLPLGSAVRYCFGVSTGEYITVSDDHFFQNWVCTGSPVLSVAADDPEHPINSGARLAVYGLKA